MPERIINIGSEPGNAGDGDSLRDAFKKTQENFSELYHSEIVTDTTISDHADPSITGSIAQSLEKAASNGGGTVQLGPGLYNCNSSLFMKQNVRLIGSGRGITQINAQHSSDVLVLGTGTFGVETKSGLEHFTIIMPDDSSANAIKGGSRQMSGYIFSLDVTGGDPQSWGVTVDSSNNFLISSFIYKGGGNGIRWINLINWNANYGDSTISGAIITLKNPNTIGVLFQGNTDNIINNILVDQVEVRSNVINTGTIGINLVRTSRITLVNVDVENMETAIVNGPQSKACAFINTYAIGCTTDYTELAPVIGTSILGGDGDFANDQRLPSRNLRLFDASFAKYTSVRTGIRDIEAHTDTTSSRVLSVTDSGGHIYTNKGATGPVTFILPNAANSKSLEFSFSVIANHELRIIPDNVSDHIRGYDGTLSYSSNGTYIYSANAGTTGTLHNINNVWWIMDGRLGVWEVSA